jgi:hypothetical protein
VAHGGLSRVLLAAVALSGGRFKVPKVGKLVFADVSWEGESLILSYRERGTGFGATIAFTGRSARTLARVLEGTRVTKADEPARIELAAEVRDHVQGKAKRIGTLRDRIAEVLDNFHGRTTHELAELIAEVLDDIQKPTRVQGAKPAA